MEMKNGIEELHKALERISQSLRNSDPDPG